MEGYWESENRDDWKRTEENARNFKVAVPVFQSSTWQLKELQTEMKTREKGTESLSLCSAWQLNVSQASWNILRAVSFSHLWKLPSTCNIWRRRRRVQEPSFSGGMRQVQHLKEQLWWLEKGREKKKKKKKTEWVCGAGVAVSLLCCLLLEWGPLWAEEGFRRTVKWMQGGFGVVFNGKDLNVS